MKPCHLKHLIVVIIAIVLTSVSVSGQDEKIVYKREGNLMSFNWTKFVFSVESPGDEILNRELPLGSDGLADKGFQVMWGHGRSSNMIIVMPMKNNARVQQDMDNGVSVGIRQEDGTIVGTQKITVGSLTGTEIRATFPNGMVAITRNFYVEPAGYSVMAMFPAEPKAEGDGVAFLNSLKISAAK